MDPLALIQHLLSLSLAIRRQVGLIDTNKTNSEALLGRVEDIAAALRELQKIPDKASFLPSLLALQQSFQESLVLVQELQPKDDFFDRMKKMMKADHYATRINILNAALDRYGAQLTLAITANIRVTADRHQAIILEQLQRIADRQKAWGSTAVVQARKHAVAREHAVFVDEIRRGEAHIQRLWLEKQRRAGSEAAVLVRKQMGSVIQRLEHADHSSLSIAELEFHEKISEGAGGSLYRGLWGDEAVLIQLLDTLNERNLRQFQLKAHGLSTVGHHPSLLDFKGASLELRGACAVFDCLDCSPLERVSAVPQKEKMLIALAEGLAFLHEKGVVHGNIQFSSIVFNRAGEAKWAGFGFAVEADVGSDVYRFGQLIQEIFEGSVPRLYQRVIDRCLEKDPSKRLNMSQVEDELTYARGLYAEQNGDIESAKRTYESLAAKKHPRAMTSLGVLALEGTGEPRHHRDVKKAQTLFLEASRLGHPRAMYNVAAIFKKGGEGVAQDLDQAIAWMKQLLMMTPEDEDAQKKLVAWQAERVDSAAKD